MAGTELVVVSLPAEIDMANAAIISGQVAAALAPGPKAIIADMAATTFCDSIGIRVLLLAHRQAAVNGTELRLLRPCHRVLRIMEVLGADAVLPIYDTLEEALAGDAEAESESWHLT